MDSKADIDVLNTVYQSASMGALGIEGLMERTDDYKLKDALADQLQEYHKFEKEAEDRIRSFNHKPEDTGAMKKAMSRIGIRMNTALDNTSSHLAEMVIQGSTMGITDLQSVLNSNRNASEAAQRLCSSLIHQEQNHIDRMKGFLGHKK